MVSKHGNQVQIIPKYSRDFASGPDVETRSSWLFLWFFMIFPNFAEVQTTIALYDSQWSANSGQVMERMRGVLLSILSVLQLGIIWIIEIIVIISIIEIISIIGILEIIMEIFLPEHQECETADVPTKAEQQEFWVVIIWQKLCGGNLQQESP